MAIKTATLKVANLRGMFDSASPETIITALITKCQIETVFTVKLAVGSRNFSQIAKNLEFQITWSPKKL